MKVDEVMLSRPLSSVYSRLLVIELKDYLKRFAPPFFFFLKVSCQL